MITREQIEKTTAEWESQNPTLAADVIGIEITSTGYLRYKRGNGSSVWSALPYLDKIPPSVGGGGNVDLESATGILPVAHGGTGRSNLTSGYFLKGNGTSDVTLQSAANAATAMCTSGSWTPKLIGYSGTNPTYTTDKGYNNETGSAYGYFMKLGKLVMVSAKISCQISDAGTGYAMIGNLPYKPRMDMAMNLLECFNCITITSADLHPVLRFVPDYGVLFKSPNGSGSYKWKANNTAGGCLITFSGAFFTE